MNDLKRCKRCDTIKPRSDFYKKADAKDRLSPYCNECKYADWQRRYAANKDHIRALARKNYFKNHAARRAQSREYIKRTRLQIQARVTYKKYGITAAEYEAMFRKQNGGCAICHGMNFNGLRLAVDHDHKTGKVRGLLCSKCNLVLGQAGDSVERLYRCADYLIAPERVAGGSI